MGVCSLRKNIMKNKQLLIWIIAAGVLIVVAAGNFYQSGGKSGANPTGGGIRLSPC